MKQKVSKKRIFLALSPLLIFNAVLFADLFFFKSMVWSQIHDPYEWGNDERLYTAKTSQKIEQDGQYLFGYEGEDANCWQMEKEWQVQECLKKHPYGGQGTMIMGGNLVIDNAQAIYINGYDSAGKNWLMSSTSEPWGNAMASNWGTSTDLFFGNNLLANGTMKTGALNFEAASSSVVFDEHKEFMVADGVSEEVKMLAYANSIDDSEANVLQILDRDVCGECDGTCSRGLAGGGYRFVSNQGMDVKEITKVNEQIRLCGYTEDCEEACCRLAEYLTDDTWDNFVGFDCESTACSDEEPPDDIGEGGTYCHPQPYPHYPRQEKPSLETVYRKEADYWFRR